MKSIDYTGSIGASKSILNRALILQSYFPELEIEGDSFCEDVQDLKTSLHQIKNETSFHIREGGTSLRFLALRLSRMPGRFTITASSRLLSRPQEELVNILGQLKVDVSKTSDSLVISGEGWKKPQGPLKVDRSRSSQFLSSLILNYAGWNEEIEIESQGEALSEDYLNLTMKMAHQLGLKYEKQENQLKLSPWLSLAKSKFQAGADLSSAFSVACFAAVKGKIQITNIIDPELQPDHRFIEIFKKMEIPIQQVENHLMVQGTGHFSGIELDLNTSPDLFPLLACLCAQAKTPSRLYGAPQLIYKESDRLAKTFELLKLAGVEFEPLADGISLPGSAKPHSQSFEFNPDQDHRMAMAAAFLKYSGWTGIKIQHPEVVRKSFPEFWQITGVTP